MNGVPAQPNPPPMQSTPTSTRNSRTGGLQLNIAALTAGNAQPPSSASQRVDGDGPTPSATISPTPSLNRLGSPTSPRRDQVVSSPLRSAFVEQRDQLFFKFGMKVEHVRRRYEQKIQPLAVVGYTQWGSTTPADLPPQLGVMLSLTDVVQFVIPHILNPPTVQAYATTFMRLLTEFPPYVALLKDMFWFFFLEFFLLAESEERLDRHRMDLLEKLRSEQPSGPSKKRRQDNPTSATGGGGSKAASAAASPSHQNSNGNDALAASFPTPAINGSHPLWKQRLSMHCKQMRVDDVNARKATLPPPKPINELLIDDEDDDLFDAGGTAPAALPLIGAGSTSGAAGGGGRNVPQGLVNPAVVAHELQEKRKQDFIRKLKRRQLALLPGHVLSTQEAYQFKYNGMSIPSAPSTTATTGSSTPRPIATTNMPSSSSSKEGGHRSGGSLASARGSQRPSTQGGRTGVPDDITSVVPYNVEDDTDTPYGHDTGHDAWETGSSASGWSVASMPASMMSEDASDVDSAPSNSPRPYSRGRQSPVSGTSELVALADRCRVKGKRRLVRGEKNFAQALSVLIEAEELELTIEQLTALKEEVASRSPEGIGKEMAVIALACDLIQREQSRMFGRMARNYVSAVRELKEHIRAVVAPSMADVMSRVVTQLLYLACPYARSLLTRRTRKVIKRKISFWIGGIEKAEVDSWGEGVAVQMDSLHKTDMHAYHLRRWAGGNATTASSPNGTISPLSGSISGASPPAPRTARRASLRIPQGPQGDVGGASGGGNQLQQQHRASVMKFTVNLDDSASMAGSLNGSIRQGPPLRRISSSLMAPSPTGSLRSRRPVVGFQQQSNAMPLTGLQGTDMLQPPTPASLSGLPQLASTATRGGAEESIAVSMAATTPPDQGTLGATATSNEFVSLSSTFSWSAGAVAYHKALDEILDDFERMQQQSAEMANGGAPAGAGAQRFLGKGPRPPNSARGGGSAGEGGDRKKRSAGRGSSASAGGDNADDSKKHLESHRHSALNRRSELWHEQGRASHAVVNSEARTRRGFFDLGCVSPFMKRYLRDGGAADGAQDRQRTATRLIKWTSS